MLPDRLDLAGVDLRDQDFLAIVGGLGDDPAEWVGDERAPPELDAGPLDAIAPDVAVLVANTVGRSDVEAVRDGVSALDRLPGIVLGLAELRLLGRVLTNGGRVEHEFRPGQGEDAAASGNHWSQQIRVPARPPGPGEVGNRGRPARSRTSRNTVGRPECASCGTARDRSRGLGRPSCCDTRRPSAARRWGEHRDPELPGRSSEPVGGRAVDGFGLGEELVVLPLAEVWGWKSSGREMIEAPWAAACDNRETAVSRFPSGRAPRHLDEPDPVNFRVGRHWSGNGAGHVLIPSPKPWVPIRGRTHELCLPTEIEEQRSKEQHPGRRGAPGAEHPRSLEAATPTVLFRAATGTNVRCGKVRAYARTGTECPIREGSVSRNQGLDASECHSGRPAEHRSCPAFLVRANSACRRPADLALSPSNSTVSYASRSSSIRRRSRSFRTVPAVPRHSSNRAGAGRRSRSPSRSSSRRRAGWRPGPVRPSSRSGSSR